MTPESTPTVLPAVPCTKASSETRACPKVSEEPGRTAQGDRRLFRPPHKGSALPPGPGRCGGCAEMARAAPALPALALGPGRVAGAARESLRERQENAARRGSPHSTDEEGRGQLTEVVREKRV